MARAGDFAVDVSDDGHGGTVVRVSGELDLATCSELEVALEGVGAGAKVVIDLTECEFLDSSALHVLLGAAGRTDAAGGTLALVAPDPRIRRVLEIASVDSRVPVHETREAAL